MNRDFHQWHWDAAIADDWQALLALAVREDLARQHDWTTLALVDTSAACRADIVSRQPGVIAGLPAVAMVLAEFSQDLQFTQHVADGADVVAGQKVASVTGPGRALLTAERPLLNVLGHLSGIATRTRQYVEAAAGTGARVYDTRKTMPGWRRLEKYAVRCGGGHNHRTGLFDAVLIKDNHIAVGAAAIGRAHFTPAEAIERVRQFLRDTLPAAQCERMIIEIEVDSLAQLDNVLPALPDIVLLDNMRCDQLREAVSRRNAISPSVELEASGGITLATIADVARCGVERISVGALTHSATWFDVGLDWSA